MRINRIPKRLWNKTLNELRTEQSLTASRRDDSSAGQNSLNISSGGIPAHPTQSQPVAVIGRGTQNIMAIQSPAKHEIPSKRELPDSKPTSIQNSQPANSQARDGNSVQRSPTRQIPVRHLSSARSPVRTASSGHSPTRTFSAKSPVRTFSGNSPAKAVSARSPVRAPAGHPPARSTGYSPIKMSSARPPLKPFPGLSPSKYALGRSQGPHLNLPIKSPPTQGQTVDSLPIQNSQTISPPIETSGKTEGPVMPKISALRQTSPMKPQTNAITKTTAIKRVEPNGSPRRSNAPASNRIPSTTRPFPHIAQSPERQQFRSPVRAIAPVSPTRDPSKDRTKIAPLTENKALRRDPTTSDKAQSPKRIARNILGTSRPVAFKASSNGGIEHSPVKSLDRQDTMIEGPEIDDPINLMRNISHLSPSRPISKATSRPTPSASSRSITKATPTFLRKPGPVPSTIPSTPSAHSDIRPLSSSSQNSSRAVLQRESSGSTSSSSSISSSVSASTKVGRAKRPVVKRPQPNAPSTATAATLSTKTKSRVEKSEVPKKLDPPRRNLRSRG